MRAGRWYDYLTFANAAPEYVWTAPRQGSDSAVDSDAAELVDAADLVRCSPLFTFGAAQVDLTLDAGLTSVLGAGSSSLGGRAWLDDDRNGIQRSAPSVTVRLLSANAGAGEVEDNAALAETRTDDDGRYRYVEPTALDPIEECAPNDWLFLPAVTYTSEQ